MESDAPLKNVLIPDESVHRKELNDAKNGESGKKTIDSDDLKTLEKVDKNLGCDDVRELQGAESDTIGGKRDNGDLDDIEKEKGQKEVNDAKSGEYGKKNIDSDDLKKMEKVSEKVVTNLGCDDESGAEKRDEHNISSEDDGSFYDYEPHIQGEFIRNFLSGKAMEKVPETVEKTSVCASKHGKMMPKNRTPKFQTVKRERQKKIWKRIQKIDMEGKQFNRSEQIAMWKRINRNKAEKIEKYVSANTILERLRNGEDVTQQEGFKTKTNDPQPVQISEDNMTTRKFSELGVSSWITQQLQTMHIKTATPVQAACIPRILDGSNILGCARTGTGKTLTFAIPILQKLSIDPYGIYALILTPNKESAFEIAHQFTAVAKKAPLKCSLKCAVIADGRSLSRQSLELSEGPHIVVATPGRLADLIESDSEATGTVFTKIQFFVLDKADQIFEGRYDDQLRPIFQSIPEKRQTLLLSATITQNIKTLYLVSKKKPYFFEDKGKDNETTVDRLKQKFVVCPVAMKDAYLVYVVKNYSEKNPKSSVMIFAETCRECQALAYMFEGLGFRVGSLHSQIPQKQRLAALSAFRSKTLQVLICTDGASRGLDIPHVNLVVNHNIPQCPKTYIHRVGRSARAGRFGSALSFVTQYDVELLQAVEKTIGKKLDELKVSKSRVMAVKLSIRRKREQKFKASQSKRTAQRKIKKLRTLQEEFESLEILLETVSEENRSMTREIEQEGREEKGEEGEEIADYSNPWDN